MRSIYVPLPESAADELRELARRELRDPRAQAAWLIVTGMKRAPAGEIDAAWAEAEAALPEGWHLRSVEYSPAHNRPPWMARAIGHGSRHGRGATPAAALLALADVLRP